MRWDLSEVAAEKQSAVSGLLFLLQEEDHVSEVNALQTGPQRKLTAARLKVQPNIINMKCSPWIEFLYTWHLVK